jgi:peptide chain release factor 2
LQKLAQEREALEPLLALRQRIDDLGELVEMAALEEGEDPTLEAELGTEAERLQAEMDRFELETLLSGEHDACNAIVEINAGAGGTESCDWVQMLLRMYLRWAQERGYQTEIVDENPGEVAGLKSVTFVVTGKNAYGYLKAERGVHRLVRISPFDANKRRHTSFASVDVIPEVEEGGEVIINPEDLRIETFRSSGAGGQHVNKTDSAVRITHIPTGIVVTCQNERSQHKNRAMAMKVLQARLQERERRENEAKMAELRGEQQAIEWGNQIRSYVFQPYTLIKDHRTGYETGDVLRVMDGAIDPLLQAYLQWQGRKNEA